MACTLPAAVALKRRFVDCSITWVVDPRFADVVRACRSVDTVVTAKPKFKTETVPTFDEPFDAGFDLQGLLKSARVIGYAKARTKLGYHWQREGSRFYTSPVRPDPTSLHVVDQYIDVVRAYGATMEKAEFDLSPLPEALESVRGKLASASVTGDFVLLNAGAGWATKRYPAASFGKVVRGIRDLGLTPVLIGGGDEAALEAGNAVAAACPEPPISFLGQTSVGELIALISLAKGHIGGDTGSTHLAAGLNIPAIGLYSITRPERCCPYGQRRNTLYDPQSLSGIEPEAVVKVLAEAIGA